MIPFLITILLTPGNLPGDDDVALEKLVTLMTGVFSSEAQAADDDDFFHIRLVMMPIWSERTDGHWLYVEQAAAGYFDKPYRQRVYQVRRAGSGVIESVVYTLPEPERAVGAWKGDDLFGTLGPDDLEIRKGCTVFLAADGDRFVGGTHERDCESTLRGARYATSEIEVLDDRLITLDRGYDGDGKQVWGSEKGGYVFVRTGDIESLR